QYREDIAQAVSRAAGQRITIGKISGNWDGMRPELKLENVTVLDAAGQPALELSRVDSTLSWRSLAAFEPRFHSLALYRPVLNLRRDPSGTIWVAGIAVSHKPDESGGIADWLLRQREIVVRDATLSWLDEMRQAPQLELKQVSLQVVNRGDRHRFGLRALPPQRLAGLLDIRGDLKGKTVRAPSDWDGRFFVQLDYADIAAWRTWVPFPVEILQGAGAIRSWVGFSRSQITEFTADVRLADVRTRLAADLPELDLTRLSGRIGWKVSAAGEEFSTAGLSLATQGGVALQPVDFLLRLAEAKGRVPAHGELRANTLELQPLAALADRLPLAAEFRKRLVDLAPRGSVHDIAAHWSGEWQQPGQYSVRGRFNELAMNHLGKIPGFSGISGNIDGNEKTGSLYLNTNGATIDMPLVFRETLQLDALTAQIAWSRSGGDTQLKMNSVSFANPHLAGSLFGSYRTSPGSMGSIDLTGNLTRADARYVSLYMPLVVGKSVRDWIDRAFPAGRSSDVSLRVKGNLDDFPFAERKDSVFQVTAKITGGVLNYADNWPKIENITGELSFRGKRMDVFAEQGTILGTRLGKVHAEIPDLVQTDEIVRVTGEAAGPTSEFLSFIDKSPVNDMIDQFTEGLRAQGSGRLALRLEIPLRETAKSKVAGSYQLTNNTITGSDGLPPLEQVSGRLDFTESSVRIQNAAGIFLGGPVTVSAATRPDSTVRIDLQGHASADNLRRAGGAPSWMQSLHGSADWRGTLTLRKKLADLMIESNLQGVASDLPAPFAKGTGEIVPLRLERKFTGPQQDRIVISYGGILSANLERNSEGGLSIIRRGNIRFGSVAAAPERDGVSVGGALKRLNIDRWMALAGQGEDTVKIEYSDIDLKIGTLEAYNRDFHDVALRGTAQSGVWRSTIAARELEGSTTWQPQGRGKLTARLGKLVIPPAVREDTGPAQQAPDGKHELPSLDIAADRFQIRGKELGKLELSAVSGERDWRIEKLRITNPDSTFTADGTWQSRLDQPRTQINLQLETDDIGKLLTRLGYPEGVRGGSAKLHGALAWPGGPQDIGYPALSGNLVLEASQGQFVKLEPGIGKLLGILSLQALPRRITLDFRDIFSEGFAFDQVFGAVKLSGGLAKTESFLIQGPSARVLMSGSVDLVRETQALRIRVTPGLSDGVSIAGALLGGPVAGVAAFLAQKVLKDPLDQIASYEYDVTGTWVNPQVSKIERQSAPEPGGAP
ncbi:MAG TPA: YhdP family protein, partial [Burkholderiales bacterium]|nr:YhdP family protein [Burkholderiales bacterium]